MRWPWRRKRDDLGALLDSVTVPVTVRAPAGTSAQIKHVPLPPVDVALPPCAPFPEHQPHEYRGVCFQCSGNTKAALLHLLSDHDCLIPPIRRYAQETTMTTPDPAAVALADAAPDNAFRTEDGGVLVRLAAGWLRIKDGYHRVLPLDAVVPGFGVGRNTVPLAPEAYTPKWETYVLDAARAVAAGGLPRSIDTAGPDPSTPPRRVVIMREDETGSAAWLRDLADRLQQYGELIGMIDPEEFTTRPRAIRSYADTTERQADRDTRDLERVEPILAARWAKDRDRQFLPSLVPTWDDLTDAERAHCIDYGLELYRAGRDDQEAER